MGSKQNKLNIRDCENEMQAKIKELVLDNEPPDKIFFLVQMLVDQWAEQAHYVVYLKIDFSKDYKVTMKFVKEEPAEWDSKFIADFLFNACDALSKMMILMYSITLRYNKPALVEIGETPEKRYTSYCLKKPNAVLEQSDYTVVG
jgi:hypothetical protein